MFSSIMIMFGALLLYTPNIFFRAKSDEEFIQEMMNTPFEKIVALQAFSKSGVIFIGGGVALLAGGL